ncbi:integrase catalytic domain-containing protein [Trichonephila inaurata madagascariensis]|uniref:Integrase catalytic domain-containing protein n=1 Tax=Trichonephila inaurata madagascariensis TaxID=2747483 RepID=A0A8X7CN09_9ARAC|nr:integrase catalytic domain-containing protein [Trichonephila inaurata madagascariensis]
MNPVDLPSRGCIAKVQAKSQWWEGHQWLQNPIEECPKSEMFPNLGVKASQYEDIWENEGNKNIAVAVDGTWQKRGYKYLNGVVTVASIDTGKNFIAKERIIWKNIIERSPWWGGFYERLVRSVKESLLKILGKALLSFEKMRTILTEIEAVLNLRPLSYVYEENNEPRPLTPMHFLICGQNQPTYPVTFAEILENASTKSSCLKRKK